MNQSVGIDSSETVLQLGRIKDDSLFGPSQNLLIITGVSKEGVGSDILLEFDLYLPRFLDDCLKLLLFNILGLLDMPLLH